MPEPTEIELITMFDYPLVTDFLKNQQVQQVENPEYIGPRIWKNKQWQLLFPIKDENGKDNYEDTAMMWGKTGKYKLIDSSNFKYVANRVYELISSKKSPKKPNYKTDKKINKQLLDNNNIYIKRQTIKLAYQEATNNSQKELTEEKKLLALELKLLIEALSDKEKMRLDHKGKWEHEEINELDSQNGGKSKTLRVKKSKKSRKSKRKSKRRTRKH